MTINNATSRGANNFKGLNLQLFAEPAETGATDPVDLPKTGLAEPDATKTYTQTELDAKLQSEADKRVADALKTSRAKWEEEFKTKLETEKQEAERLAKLSESDRQKAIFDKQQADFETERLSFQREKLELQITKELAEKGLPINFAKLLVTDDADSSLENIKNFEKDWQDALAKAVIEKVKGTSPGAGSTTVTESGLGKRLAAARKESEEVIKENPYF